MTTALETPSKLGRTPVARGLAASTESPIERTGGKFSAGLIRGFSVITRGEALGHGLWIDAVFLGQVAEAINLASDKTGSKSRFTHPDLSGDGLGKSLGRVFSAKVDGDRVFGDLHLSASAHKSPEGDLAGYVMDLATEDPEAFGASIAFYRDTAAMEAFANENRDDQGRFQSPDPENRQNLRHVRLRELVAVDVVDQPAANPGGLFHRGRFALLEASDELLGFVFGLSEQSPEVGAELGIDPSRLRDFVQRFAQSRGLQFSKKGSTMTLETGKAGEPTQGTDDLSKGQTTPPGKESSKETSTGTGTVDPQATFRAELGRFTEKFGAENGVKWFQEGVSFDAAMERHCEALSAQNKKLADDNKSLGDRLSAAATGLGEEKPLDGKADSKADGEKPATDQYDGVLPPGLAAYAANVKVPNRK